MANFKNYCSYHKGWRGSEAVINFNYKNKKFRKRVDACRDWLGNSPCVMYCLKIHKMAHNHQLPNREKIMTNLLPYQIHRKYLPETKEAILSTKVTFPKGILNQGVLLKDFAALEKANGIAIALYYIKPPESSNKNSDVTITCLRAPKPSIIQQYGGIDKVCCLALISTDHVVYIPDIFAYNKSF